MATSWFTWASLLLLFFFFFLFANIITDYFSIGSKHKVDSNTQKPILSSMFCFFCSEKILW